MALRIFKAMAKPYVDYPALVLYSCPDKLIMRLQQLQNHVIRICLCAEPRASIGELHQTTKILLVKNRIKFNINKAMHRMIDKPNCGYRNNIQSSTRLHTVPVFMNIFPNSVRFQRSLCGFGFATWNRLPVDVRKTTDAIIFNRIV